MRLTVAERKVMEVVWAGEKMSAKQIAEELAERVNWSKTTSYTMVSRCVEKGYLLRSEPNYTCEPAYTREQVSHFETEELLESNFHGSADLLVASLVEQKKLSLKEIEKLYQTLQEIEANA